MSGEWKPSRNWRAIAPPGVASAQDVWDRRAAVLRMREVGLKFSEIGDRLNVSASRARQIYEMAAWYSARGRRAPIVRWMEDTEDLRRLAEMERRLLAKEFDRPAMEKVVYRYPPWRKVSHSEPPVGSRVIVCGVLTRNEEPFVARRTCCGTWHETANGKPVVGTPEFWMPMPPLPGRRQ